MGLFIYNFLDCAIDIDYLVSYIGFHDNRDIQRCDRCC